MYTYKPKTQQCKAGVQQMLLLIGLFFTFTSFAQPLNSEIDQLETTPTDYYRIEVILFKVLNGSNNGRLSNTISDYSDTVILEEISEFSINNIQEKTDLEDSVANKIDNSRSEVIESAWKRLSRSRNFRPLAYRQWDETRADTVARHAVGGVEGIATRIHGENILPEAAKQPSTIKVEPNQYSEENMFEASIESEPVYKLDGRATFGQGRFLHINLDFEYRDWNPQYINNRVKSELGVDSAKAPESAEKTPAYITYSLKKTRQIVPQKPELFDNEQFGVLVYLEEVSPADEQVHPATAPLPDR